MSGPAARLVQAAETGIRLTLPDGRRADLRAMTALDRLRLFKAAGPELAGNEAWLGLAYLACSVSAIDEVPVPFPANEAQIEALVGRLGDGALEAIADHFAALAPAGCAAGN